MRVNLIYRDNGAGLSQDARILEEVLSEKGARVQHLPHDIIWRQRVTRFLRRQGVIPSANLNLHLQHVTPYWFGAARRNLLIPNQEWFRPEWARYLPYFDVVLAKSHHAYALFSALGARTEYVGFTTRDLGADGLTPGSGKGVLHVAGQSRQKGTEAVLAAWRAHPDWPWLTVVQRARAGGHPPPAPALPNVRYICERMGEAALVQLIREHVVHVRPSEAEGFGHPFAEAMSCGGIVVTLDAPPMNELVKRDRGFLVSAVPAGRQGVDTLHRPDPASLDRAISAALALPAEARERMRRAARAWFVQNDADFRHRLTESLSRFG